MTPELKAKLTGLGEAICRRLTGVDIFPDDIEYAGSMCLLAIEAFMDENPSREMCRAGMISTESYRAMMAKAKEELKR